MKRTSISQAKNQLSALLKAVRRGETVLIYDRQRPVARLEGVAASDVEEDGRLASLERDGLLRRARKPLAAGLVSAKPPKASPGASILRALLTEREEGR